MTLVERITELVERLRAAINERGLPAGGAAGQVLAKSSAADRAVGWVTPSAGSGGSALSGAATITIPSARFDHTETVPAPGVTPAALISIGVAPHDDADENHELLLDPMTITGRAGTDEITINAAFSGPTSGPIKLNWSVI